MSKRQIRSQRLSHERAERERAAGRHPKVGPAPRVPYRDSGRRYSREQERQTFTQIPPEQAGPAAWARARAFMRRVWWKALPPLAIGALAAAALKTLTEALA